MVFGITAHVDAGKTTLSEALLYHAGQIKKLGRVDHQDAFLDTDAMERERGITIFSKQARLPIGGQMVTLLDTPGHVDFSAEMERALAVCDYAIVVISATSGIQGHTRTLYRLLRHYEVPIFFFVNKMDMDGADRESILAELKAEFGSECVAFDEVYIDENGQIEADEEICEEIAVCEDALLEQYMETGTLHVSCVQELIASRKLFPCYFGSALLDEGVDRFLNGLGIYTKENVYPSDFRARVYKISRDEKGTRLTHLKVTGGSLRVKDKINLGDEIGEEKVEQLRLYSGERFEAVTEVKAGEICAVCGLKSTYPGMSIGQMQPVEQLLEPVLRYRIDLPDDVNPMEFMEKLRQLEEEDPKLSIVWDEEHKEINISMMGQVQIEILTRMIQERFGVTVVFGKGSIVYKETIAEPVEGVGHFEPLRHYAEVHLLLEPGEPGSGITVQSACGEEVLAKNWQRLIATHVLEREHRGVLTGSTLCDVKVTILSGRAHPKHTEGGDFRKATYRAIRHGLCRTKSILLEPYYDFVLEIPSGDVGRAMTDIDHRHGKQEAPEYVTVANRDMAIIRGSAPVSTLQDYGNEVHAYTKGLGSLTLTLRGYDVCHNAAEVINSISYDADSDTRNPASSVFCAHGAGFVVPWEEVEQYMHLPYCYENGTIHTPQDGYAYDIAGAAEMVKRQAAETMNERINRMNSYELDQELMDVYQREFGKSEDEIMQERRANRNREVSVPKTPSVKMDKKGNPIYPKKDARERCLIVDGYNVIYASQYLRELSKVNVDGARDALADALCNYQGYTGDRLLLVFDAYKRKEHCGTHFAYHNIEIWYTRTDETADAFIERLVHEENQKYQFTVATSDGLEQLTVMSAGALRMPARELIDKLNLAQS